MDRRLPHQFERRVAGGRVHGAGAHVAEAGYYGEELAHVPKFINGSNPDETAAR
jgi:hypothetical protein